MLVTDPASTSAWVTVYEPVQVSDAPGARLESGQLTLATRLSETPIPVMSVDPVFCDQVGVMDHIARRAVGGGERRLDQIQVRCRGRRRDGHRRLVRGDRVGLWVGAGRRGGVRHGSGVDVCLGDCVRARAGLGRSRSQGRVRATDARDEVVRDADPRDRPGPGVVTT